ncbi:MAG: OmpH family outer membrane protein [Phycisphaeraceae bacterium]
MTGRQSMTVTLAVCTTLMLVSIATLQGQQNAQGQPTRVAVVGVEQVFNNLAERRAVEADIQSQIEALQKEQQDRRTEIQDLENDYSILADGSDAAQQVREELESKLVSYEVWQQVSSRKMESERAIRISSIYRKMLNTIEQVAEREGYDMVMFRDEVPEFRRAQDQQQIAAMIQSRKLLYATDELDISDRVLQRMNNEFEGR